MVFRKFNTGLIARIVILLTTVFLSGLTIAMIREKELFFIPILLFVILAFQVVEFIIYTNRINRNLATILESLKSTEHTTKFDTRAGMPMNKLYGTFNEVTAYIRNLKFEKEAQYEYLKTVVSHMNIGIICLKESDQIQIINQAALDILGTGKPGTWADLSASVPEFTTQSEKIQGKGNSLIEFTVDGMVLRLSLKVSTLVIFKEELRIITFQDIRTEIEQTEVEAWQKLIRILRHEIMNSVTPISSMTETVLMLVEDHLGAPKKTGVLSDEDIIDIRDSIKTIHDRSEGLHEFVERYREVTRIPHPKAEPVSVQMLSERTIKLLGATLSEGDIHTRVSHKNPDLEIIADPNLIEQVLINLLKNSIEALRQTENKTIEINSEGDSNSQSISITDNGCGIAAAELDEIFVPFYSTKEEGSGIGLSLSKQIMHLHGGDIVVNSKPGVTTTFKLIFHNKEP
jgi:two-component system nitrogen regulation sensor histidine kinase NtrY